MQEINGVSDLPIEQLREGMVLAKDILNSWGAVLLPKDTILDTLNYPRLSLNNIRTVQIYADTVDNTRKTFINRGKGLPELVVERIEDKPEFAAFQKEYDVKTEVIKNTLIDIGNGAEIDLESLYELTNGIMSKLKFKSDLFNFLSCLRSADEHTFTHSNNVALLCNLFASWLNLNEEDTLYLTTGGVLHDVGKTKIPSAVLNKKGKLTVEEFGMIKSHTTLGYAALKNQNIPQNIKLGALQHHEKIDGTGYPLGFKDEKINSMAKMIAICDIYDAMTANRAYRDKICPFTVIKAFEQRSYGELDTQYLLVFLQNIAYTYVGSYVELSDGRYGQVVFINKTDLSNPMVRVENDVLDLKEKKELSIIRIL